MMSTDDRSLLVITFRLHGKLVKNERPIDVLRLLAKMSIES